MISLTQFLLFSQAADSEATQSLTISNHIMCFVFYFILEVVKVSSEVRVTVKFTVVIGFDIAAWPEGKKPFGNCCFLSSWVVATNGRQTKFVLPQ